MFKTKKFIRNLSATLLLLALLAVSFSACGKSSPGDKYALDKSEQAYEESADNFTGGGAEILAEAPSNDRSTQPILNDKNIPNVKLIWRANLNLETLEYEKLLNSIQKSINEMGGFIESSSQNGGIDVFGDKDRQFASITARIPSKKLDEFLETASSLGSVTHSSRSCENITLEYADAEARKAALEAEYSKLLELMSNATDINAVIAIEARLSEVRYQLDEFSSTLKKYDNLVDYSTVDIRIEEVEVISNTSSSTLSERIANGFASTFIDIKAGAEDFLVFVVVKSPIILVLVVVVFLAVKALNKLFERKGVKSISIKRNKKSAEIPDNKNEDENKQ